MNIQIKGTLGPIQKTPVEGIEIAPFTLLIGQQGTGKSILSQLVYFYRNIAFLARYYARQSTELDEEIPNGLQTELTNNQYAQIVRKCLNSLRSKSTSFLSLLGGSETTITWHAKTSEVFNIKIKRSASAKSPNLLQVSPDKHLKAFIKAAIEKPLTRADRNGDAIFIPAERIAYSHIQRPSEWAYLSFPDTLAFFGSALEDAAQLFSPENSEPVAVRESSQTAYGGGRLQILRAKIQEISERTLNGRPIRQADRWRWQANPDISFNIDMASSGQKANWSIFLLAQAVLYWKQNGELPADFALHVEEPEIHLHPEAQCDVMRTLVMLAAAGIQVMVTTHSLTSLYVLNNMMIKFKKHGKDWAAEHPGEAVDPGIVAAYHCTPIQRDGSGGEVISIIDRAVGFISEQELGRVNDGLGNEFYRLLETPDHEN